MFSSGTPGPAERRTRGGAAVRRSQSRAGSIAALAAGSEAGTPPPTSARTGLRARAHPARAGSSRRQSLLPPGRPASRAASRLGSAALFDGDSTGGEDAALDAEEDPEQQEDQAILLKSETHTVSVLGGAPRSQLPAEVIEVLANSDFYSDPHTAVLDHAAGYACLMGKSNCYVWSISALLHQDNAIPTSTPTCYIFPVPEPPNLSLSATVFSPVPFVAFVSLEGGTSSGRGREPGFLLVTTWGQIVYWRSVSAALSGIHAHEEATLGLHPGEVVRATSALSPTRYLLATSGSRLFSLRIQTAFSSGTSIAVKPISKGKGMLARMGSLFGGAELDPRGGIVAVATRSLPRNQRNQAVWSAYAFTDCIVQEWRISDAGEEYVGEVDLHEPIRETLCGVLSIDEGHLRSLDITDAVTSGSNNLVLLLAYTSTVSEQTKSSSTRPRTSYAVAIVTDDAITYMKALSYSHEVDPRPLSSPRLRLLPGENICFVTFPDLVIATFLETSLSFEESVALKDADKDRLLGTCTSDPSSLVMLAANTGLLKLDIDVAYIRSLAAEATRLDPADVATRNLKSKLEQAVLFADNQHNPLTFNLTLTNEAGDLVSAAESVSRDILCISSLYLPTIIDLRAQIADRATRLRFLMRYLHDNSLTNRLSKTARRHLAWDAEKLAGVAALWQAYTATSNEHQGVIMAEAADKISVPAHEEDVVRAMFRKHADRLADLFEEYLPILEQRGTNASLPLTERTSVLHQIDRDLSLTYKALTRHRIEQGNLYGIPLGPDSQTCLSEPWSSRPRVLKLMRLAFEATDKLLVERSRVLGSNIDDDRAGEYGSSSQVANGRTGMSLEDEREIQRVLKAYLVELADYTLAMHQERMSYLQSMGDDSQAVSELRELLETYVALRPRVIDTMVRLSRTNAAYDLAERYRDFRSLVVLCNDSNIGSQARLHHYIQKYQEDFAFALYDWYLESGRSYDLMTQDGTYGPMLSKFLRLRQLPGLAWMQDVVESRIGDAADALLEQAESETNLSEQKLMLSLGKLARVAGYTRAEIDTSERVQQSLEVVDDRLDIVASHDRLMDLCRTVIDPRDALKPVETQATVLVGRLCSRVTNAEYIKLGSFLFRRLLLGDALLPEDLVDLFSMKDNTSEDQVRDFAYSLEILSRDRQTPQTRRDIAAKAVWRRVYLADDFVEARRLASSGNDSALAELLRSTALYATIAACQQRQAGQLVVLRPSEALYTSTPAEDASLLARFSSEVYHGEVDVEAIASEYARESHLLQGMCDDKMVRLGEFFDEAQRLARLDSEQRAAQSDILAEMEDSMME